MTVVVDSSALVALCTRRAGGGPTALFQRLASSQPNAPDIVDAEFHHALRGLVLGGKMSGDAAALARAQFSDMPLTRIPSRGLMGRVWSLRSNLTAYDACFVALAEAMAMPLITCDAKLGGAPGHHAQVLVFGSS